MTTYTAGAWWVNKTVEVVVALSAAVRPFAISFTNFFLFPTLRPSVRSSEEEKKEKNVKLFFYSVLPFALQLDEIWRGIHNVREW